MKPGAVCGQFAAQKIAALAPSRSRAHIRSRLSVKANNTQHPGEHGAVSHLLTPGIPITAVAHAPGMPAAAEIAEPLAGLELLEEASPSGGFLESITRAIMPGGASLPQPRLSQLRAEVAALQGREQQLARQVTEVTAEAHELRTQLAAREEAAEQLAQAKELAEAAALEMQQQLEAAQAQVAAAVEQAASAQEAAATVQEAPSAMEEYRLGLQEALKDLQNERLHREQLKLEILNAEHSSAAAKQLAAEVQGLQRKLAGVVKKQVATAAALQSKLDQATSECTQLRCQLAAAQQKAADFESQLVMAAGERGRLQERCSQLEAEVESVRSAAAAEQLKLSSLWSARVEEAMQEAAEAKTHAAAEMQRSAVLEQESHALHLALERAEDEAHLARLSTGSEMAASDRELLRRMEHDLQMAAQQVGEATRREQQVLAELREATEAVNVLYGQVLGPDAQLDMQVVGQTDWEQPSDVQYASTSEAASLALQLQQARQEVAEAQAAAQSAKSRSSLLDKAWTAALEDSKALHAERRELKAALAQSQREALALAAKLEAARQQASDAQSLADQLEEARMEVAAAKALATRLAKDAVASHEQEGRSGTLLQQAWPAMPLWKGTCEMLGWHLAGALEGGVAASSVCGSVE